MCDELEWLVDPEIDPDHVIGVHVNNLGTFPSGDPAELAGMTETDRARLALMSTWGADMSGYAIVQSTRPQTISYALTDSPVGQLAWIAEKFKEWTDPGAGLPEDAIDLDLSIYWLTGTAGSAARVYYEDARSWGQTKPRSSMPTGVVVFPNDITLRPLAERDHNLVHRTEFSRGGHFAALEAPDLLAGDVRTFFRRLRRG